MRILIAEDDKISRRILNAILKKYGDCDLVVDGAEAIRAYNLAWEDDLPYDLICLDIMMPNMDGHQALKKIRASERKRGIRGSQEVKVLMVTALSDPCSVFEAFYDGGATGYLVKPIISDTVVDELHKFGLLVHT